MANTKAGNAVFALMLMARSQRVKERGDALELGSRMAELGVSLEEVPHLAHLFGRDKRRAKEGWLRVKRPWLYQRQKPFGIESSREGC